MFARVVECHSKVGRSEHVGNKLEDDVLPILQKQPGFVDFLTLSDRINRERLMCISCEKMLRNITGSTIT
jgi:hypothetical protein